MITIQNHGGLFAGGNRDKLKINFTAMQGTGLLDTEVQGHQGARKYTDNDGSFLMIYPQNNGTTLIQKRDPAGTVLSQITITHPDTNVRNTIIMGDNVFYALYATTYSNDMESNCWMEKYTFDGTLLFRRFVGNSPASYYSYVHEPTDTPFYQYRNSLFANATDGSGAVTWQYPEATSNTTYSSQHRGITKLSRNAFMCNFGDRVIIVKYTNNSWSYQNIYTGQSAGTLDAYASGIVKQILNGRV